MLAPLMLTFKFSGLRQVSGDTVIFTVPFVDNFKILEKYPSEKLAYQVLCSKLTSHAVEVKIDMFVVAKRSCLDGVMKLCKTDNGCFR